MLTLNQFDINLSYDYLYISFDINLSYEYLCTSFVLICTIIYTRYSGKAHIFFITSTLIISAIDHWIFSEHRQYHLFLLLNSREIERKHSLDC